MKAQAARRRPAPLPSALEVFELRCWARAYLFAVGEYSLHDAVDELQDFADRLGLIDQLGQDAVQAEMQRHFDRVCRQ